MTRGKLGALPRDFSVRAPRFEDYVTGTAKFLPPAPAYVDHTTSVQLFMYCNGPDPGNPPASPDGIGDCTVVGMANAFAVTSVMAGWPQAVFDDGEIIKAYTAVSGYDPSTGANDNGSTLTAVCQYATTTGFTDKTGKVHKLAGWAEIEAYTNLPLLKQALSAFGVVYMAFNLPESFGPQFDAGGPITWVKGSPTEGGHCMDLASSSVGEPGVNDEALLSWAAAVSCNQAFMRHQACEAVALVTEDYVRASGTSIAGLDLDQMLADAKDCSA